MADALVGLAQYPVGTDSRYGARTQVTVHVDAEVLADVHADGRCELEDGSTIAADTMRRLSCDADVVAVVHGKEGQPLGSGRRTRKVTSRLRRALWERDRGCGFPGCTCQRFLHAHHVRHWGDGGPTQMDNLLMLCPYHHRLVHECGFSIEQSPGGLRFLNPDGEAIVPGAWMPAVHEDPLLLWRRQHPHTIDANTTMPGWDGESADYEEMLRPLFERERGLCA
jgi:hypothetical protein